MKGGVPFSLLACILWETSLAHRFHRKSPKSPKSAQNRGNPPNRSNFATIVFDKFGLKALPLFGVAFIRSKKIGAKALPLFGVLPLLTQKIKVEVSLVPKYTLRELTPP